MKRESITQVTLEDIKLLKHMKSAMFSGRVSGYFVMKKLNDKSKQFNAWFRRKY